MSTRILLIVLIVVVVLLVPVAFIFGQRRAAPVAQAVTQPAAPVDGSVAVADPPPPAEHAAPADEKAGGAGDLFSGLVASVGKRVSDDARRVVDQTVDSVTKEVSARAEETAAKLERDLDERLNKGRGEAERSARKVGEDLDRRSESLTRATAAQSERLDEQVDAIAKSSRASAETITKSAADLRTLVTTTMNEVNSDADKAKAKLLKLAKDGTSRAQKIVGKAGVVLPTATARISDEIAGLWRRCADEIDANQASFQQRTTAAHLRFTEAVTKAQAEAEQQRQKALTVVQTASESLRTQVASAERELVEAVKRAEEEADKSLARTMDKAEQKPESHATEPVAPAARRSGK